MSTRFGLSVAVTLGFFCAGCSFLFTKKPPSEAQREVAYGAPKCTSSLVAPVVDTIIGSYQLVRTGIAIDRNDGDYAGLPITRSADIAFGTSLAGLFLSSAVYGYIITSNCRELKAQAASTTNAPHTEPARE